MTSCMTCMKYFLLFCGLVLTTQAAFVGRSWPRNIAQARTIEETDNEIKPVKSDIRIKDLSGRQEKLFLESFPKMIEKTKILNNVRKLKDQGEERTKVIYRTRLIGQFSPKMLANLNLIEKLLDGLNESDEEDISNASINEQSKINRVNKELKDIDVEFERATKGDMPANQHSSKKDLRNNEITVKSVENMGRGNKETENKVPLTKVSSLNDVRTFYNTPTSPSKKVSFPENNQGYVETKLKQPDSTFRKINFVDTTEDENETGFKQPVNPFQKLNLVDSLELYRNQLQQKKVQALNELKSYVNNNLLHVNTQPNPKPTLQRQFSIYRHPTTNTNNEYIKNVNMRSEVTLKPILKHPLDTSIKLPSGNNMNVNNVNRVSTQNLNTNSNYSPANKVNPMWPEPNLTSNAHANPLQTDWLSSVLMRKVAQAEAAQLSQARAMHTQMNEAHQREQQILQHEQQHR